MNDLTRHAKQLMIYIAILDAVMSCDWYKPIEQLGVAKVDEVVKKMERRGWVEITGKYTRCEIVLTGKGWSVVRALDGLRAALNEYSFG